MPTIEGKNHDSGHIHLNTDMTEEERGDHMLHIVMTQYALKIGQISLELYINNINGEELVTYFYSLDNGLQIILVFAVDTDLVPF